MEQKTLATWLKCIIVGVGLCGVALYFVVCPLFGQSLISEDDHDFYTRFLPYLVFLCISGIPCYITLVLGWKISTNIGKGEAFSQANATHLKRIAWLAAGDSLFFFVGNIVLLLVSVSHPGILLLSLLVVFVGIAIAVAAAVLSHLVHKAQMLQEQCDLTI